MKTHHQSGSVLLEALLSILIFAFGVLSLFGMQSVAMKNMSQSNYRATAVYLASQLIGSAQGDINHLADYQYSATTTCPADATAAVCSSPAKVCPWLQETCNALPHATSTVAPLTVAPAAVTIDTANSTMTVTVYWRAPGEKTAPHQHTVSTYVSY